MSKSSEDRSVNLALDSISDLTDEFLTKLVRKYWPIQNSQFDSVAGLTIQVIDQGVLSQVYRVSAVYHYNNSSNNAHSSIHADTSIPTQWIVKLPRQDLHLEWMFQSEKVFYEAIAPFLRGIQDDIPFTIPRMLLATDTCLILEGIQDTTCHDLLSGTPPEKLPLMTLCLASLHAHSWKSDSFRSHTQNLNGPPGIGQRLHPLQKEYLFQQQWREAVTNTMIEDPAVQEFIQHLCIQMDRRRLRDIHTVVHDDKYACVHGDFHIANFLFPHDESQKKPVLIDWATFGYGNPMTDLAFFAILNDCVATRVQDWLKIYYDCLTVTTNHSREDIVSTIGSFPDMLNKFRWAMLCQWMVLVAYDKMSRQLAEGQQDATEVEIKLKHFRNVNRRAALVLSGLGSFDTILDSIPDLLEHERQEAIHYCAMTPLSI